MSDKENSQSRDTLLYVIVALVYAIIWLAAFSHLQRGPYLVLAGAVSIAYAIGQGYAMRALGKLALSADSIALPVSLVVMIAVVLAMVRGGWLSASLQTYLEIMVRFFTAFALGHIVVMAVAFVADKFSDRGI